MKNKPRDRPYTADLKDAGFDPNELRNQQGEWTKGGSVNVHHVETGFAPPSSEIDRLDNLVDFKPFDSLPTMLRSKFQNKEYQATGSIAFDEKLQHVAGGVADAIDNLKNLGFHPRRFKRYTFSFVAYNPREVSMTTYNTPMNQQGWLLNTTGVEESLNRIKRGETGNVSGEYATHIFTSKISGGVEPFGKEINATILKAYYRSCMYHEFAHVIDNESYRNLSSDFIVEQADEVGALYDNGGQINTQLLRNALAIAYSSYATSKPEEAFAEAFAKWMDEPDQMTPRMRNFFKKKIGNLTRSIREGDVAEDGAPQIEIHHYPDPKIIDKNGHVKIDKEAWRKFEDGIATDAAPHSAGLALIDPNGYMLFLRRDEHGDHRGKWAFPGGKVNPGETPEHAAEREAIEEIGYVSNGEYPVSFKTREPVKFETFVKPVDGQFEPRWLMEHSAYTWRKPNNPPEPLHPGVRKLLYKMNGYVAAYDAGFDPDEPRIEKGASHAGRWTSWLTGFFKRSTPTSLPVESDDKRREKTKSNLRKWVKEFGYDPDKVQLRDDPYDFELDGMKFKAAGCAQPNGNVYIFDPSTSKWSNTQIAGLLAHETFHEKYNVVLKEYQKEGSDGPLHDKFSKYDPEQLRKLDGMTEYSREHWKNWTDKNPPNLFERVENYNVAVSEPINETLAEIAQTIYMFPMQEINPLWRKLYDDVIDEYEKHK